MDPRIIAALIGIGGVILGAVLQNVLPDSRLIRFLTGKPRHPSLIGDWISEWGPSPGGPFPHREILHVSKQNGEHIEGTIDRDAEPERKWSFKGRYNGRFLQLLYYPAPDAKNPLFLDFGAFILEHHADGTFTGLSIGWGNYENEESMSTDHHRIQKRVSGAA